MLTSIQNDLIKKVYSLHQKKYRQEYNLFIIEGLKGLEEALTSNLEIEYVFVTDTFSKKMPDIQADKIYTVTDNVMKKISTTESPPEILAVAKKKSYVLKDLFTKENPIILVLENIRDPGNLGTIIRTAMAANVSGIILTDESVDIYNPKTVRSSAGNLWKLPIITFNEKQQIKNEINKINKCDFVATTVKDKSKSYYDLSFKNPCVIMFGSEAEGLSEFLTDQADFLATIPMSEQVESINLSISVGVILYEALRQRQFSN